MDKQDPTIINTNPPNQSVNPPKVTPTPSMKTPQSPAFQSLPDTPCYEPKYILTGLVVLIILGIVGFLVIRILPLREWTGWLLR